MKKLVLYFSVTGHTKQAADQLSQLTQADEVRIEPVKPYPIDYNRCTTIAQNQITDQARPKIKTKLPDLKQYDLIYLGFPTWWQQPPMIINTLFEQNDFAGKKIVPFITSGSSPLSDSIPFLKEMATGAKILPGFRYTNLNELKEFLQKNPES